MTSLAYRVSARPLVLATCLALMLAVGVGHAVVVFEEHFDDPSFAQWVIHGDGVLNPGGVAEIVCTYWWYDGLETVERFNRAAARDAMVVEGWFKMDAANPRCASIVWLQDGWGHPYNCYAVEFAKDQDAPGDNRVFFAYDLDDQVVTYEAIGVFQPGEWIGWRFCLMAPGCEVWLNYGSGWIREFTETAGTFAPVAINLHGSGDTSGGGGPNTSYWDNILVHTEISCPVLESSWSSIKALYRQ
ncbi:MAG: hypothetical protein ABIE42_01530 [Candidatus Eisenbacteria bacterium]